MRFKFFLLLCVSCSLFADPTETVTTLDNSGVGSLRQAITDVNNNGAILFADGVDGTITLSSALPIITKNLTINGIGNTIVLSRTGLSIFDINSNEMTLSDMINSTSNINGNMDIATGATVNFNQPSNGTYSGIISGAGTVKKEGSANLTLSGTSTYTGGTSIEAGSLTVLADANLGTMGTITISSASLIGSASLTITRGISISSNATFVEQNAGEAMVFSNVISGSGSLVKSGEGSIVLNNVNTYSGDTTLNEGTIQLLLTGSLPTTTNVISSSGTTLVVSSKSTGQTVATLSGAGEVLLGANTITVGNATDFTFSGQITSTGGGVTKQGTGNWTLSGVNEYTGTTTITAGTLTGTHTSFGSGTVLNVAGIIFDQDTDGTFSNTIEGGGGTLTKTGTGMLTLTGPNEYTGSTTINGGTLKVTGNMTATGETILTSGTLEVDTNATLSKFDPSSLNGGVAIVKGSLSQNDTTTVGSSSTLKGTGTLGNTVVNGTIAPGLSIGTMVIAGNYTQGSGSTLENELDNAGNTDLLDITGSATIQSNATLSILAEPGVYAPSTSYTILDADGGLSGTFTNVITNNPGLNFTVSYTDNQVILTLTNLVATNCDRVNIPLASNLSVRMNQLQANMILEVQNQRLTQKGCCEGIPNYQPYVVYDYSKTGIVEKLSMPEAQDHLSGWTFGCDFFPSDWWMFGAGIGYIHGNTIATNGCGKVKANHVNFAGYTQLKPIQHLYIDSMVVFAKDYYETYRSTVNSGYNHGRTHGYDFFSNLRTTYQVDCEVLCLQPMLGINYSIQQIGGYTEDRIRTTSLNVGEDWFDLLEFEEGISIWSVIDHGKECYIPQFGFTYVQQVLRNTHDVNVHIRNSPNNTVSYQNLNQTYWKLDVDFAAYFGGCNSLSFHFQTQGNDRYESYQEYRGMFKLTF